MITAPARSTRFGKVSRLVLLLLGAASATLLNGCGPTPTAQAATSVTGNWTGRMEGFGFPFTARFGADGTFAMIGRWQGSHGPVSQEMSGTYTQRQAGLDLQVTRYVYTDHLGTRSRPIAPLNGRLTDGGHTLTVSYGSGSSAFQGGYAFRR